MTRPDAATEALAEPPQCKLCGGRGRLSVPFGGENNGALSWWCVECEGSGFEWPEQAAYVNWQPSTQQGDNTSPLQREVDQKAALIEKMARAMWEADANSRTWEDALGGRVISALRMMERARAAYEAEHEQMSPPMTMDERVEAATAAIRKFLGDAAMSPTAEYIARIALQAGFPELHGDQPKGWIAPAALRGRVDAVLETFSADEESGYRSRDRQYVIEMLQPMRDAYLGKGDGG